MRTHTGEKPYKCTVCDETFSHSGALKRHVLTHTGDSTSQCKVCGHGFSTVSSLKTHMMTHTGEKPYKCTVCKYVSSTGGRALKRHMMTLSGLFIQNLHQIVEKFVVFHNNQLLPSDVKCYCPCMATYMQL